jgi:hypothetical protein
MENGEEKQQLEKCVRLHRLLHSIYILEEVLIIFILVITQT